MSNESRDNKPKTPWGELETLRDDSQDPVLLLKIQKQASARPRYSTQLMSEHRETKKPLPFVSMFVNSKGGPVVVADLATRVQALYQRAQELVKNDAQKVEDAFHASRPALKSFDRIDDNRSFGGGEREERRPRRQNNRRERFRQNDIDNEDQWK